MRSKLLGIVVLLGVLGIGALIGYAARGSVEPTTTPTAPPLAALPLPTETLAPELAAPAPTATSTVPPTSTATPLPTSTPVPPTETPSPTPTRTPIPPTPTVSRTPTRKPSPTPSPVALPDPDQVGNALFVAIETSRIRTVANSTFVKYIGGQRSVNMYYAVMMERVHKRQPVQDPLQFYRSALTWWITTSEANGSKPSDQRVQLYFPAPSSYETMLWKVVSEWGRASPAYHLLCQPENAYVGYLLVQLRGSSPFSGAMPTLDQLWSLFLDARRTQPSLDWPSYLVSRYPRV